MLSVLNTISRELFSLLYMLLLFKNPSKEPKPTYVIID